MNKTVYVLVVMFILLVCIVNGSSDFGPMCYNYCQDPTGCVCDGSCRNTFAVCGASCQGTLDSTIANSDTCTPNPILHLKMDESSWAYDQPDVIDSIGNRNFRSKNAVVAPGNFGNAGLFNPGHYMYSTDATSIFNGRIEFTLSVWVKSDVTNTDNGIFRTKGGDEDDRYLGLRYDKYGDEADDGRNNGIKASIKTNYGFQVVESSSNLQTTDWQHIVIRWKSGENLELFVNGQKDNGVYRDIPVGGHLTDNPSPVIGKGVKDQSSNEGWDGLIDDFRLYDVKLSDYQIQNIYNSGSSPPSIPSEPDQPTPASTAIIDYDLSDITNPNVLIDSSGNDFHGVIHGGDYYTDKLKLYENDNYVDLGYFDFKGDKLNVKTKIKAYQYDGDARIVSKEVDGGYDDRVWTLDLVKHHSSKAHLRFRLKVSDGNGGCHVEEVNGGYIFPNSPYTIEADYDGSFMRVYINGMISSNKQVSGDICWDQDHAVWIGGSYPDPSHRPFHGYIYYLNMSGEELVRYASPVGLFVDSTNQSPSTTTPTPTGGTFYPTKNVGGVTLTGVNLISEDISAQQEKEVWDPMSNATLTEIEDINSYILGDTQKIETSEGFVFEDIKYAEINISDDTGKISSMELFSDMNNNDFYIGGSHVELNESGSLLYSVNDENTIILSTETQAIISASNDFFDIRPGSKIIVDENFGAMCMILSTGSRYEYHASSSPFALYIPQNVDEYEVCLKRNPVQNFYLDTNSCADCGLLNFLVNYNSLNSRIEYESKDQFFPVFTDMIDSDDPNNRIDMKMNNDFTRVERLLINNPINQGETRIFNSHFEILEKDNSRFVKITRSESPDIIDSYRTVFRDMPVTFSEKDLTQENEGNEIIFFGVNSTGAQNMESLLVARYEFVK